MATRRLTKMANNKGANFVPWGIPPWRDTGDDNDFPTLTLWDLWDKKAPIHLIMDGCTLRTCNSSKSTLWSTRSKPLEKSAKKIRIEVLPLSKNCSMEWKRYTSACVVHFSFTQNCLISNWPSTCLAKESWVKPSIILARSAVKDIGLKSSSSTFEGLTLGTGTTMDCFHAQGTTPSTKEVL